MRCIPLLLILAAPLAAGAALAQMEPQGPPSRPGDLPLPGYWEITTKYSSVIGGETTDRRCYGPADVHKLAQPCNHHHVCVYSTNDVHDGRIVLKGKWFSKEKDGTTGGEVADFAGSGTYTPESLSASAQGHYEFLGMSMPATAELTAHRVSATCPPDAKKG
jgi:hypothetical protein